MRFTRVQHILALNANHLLQGMDDLHQIRLRPHHRVDVFVSHRDLVDNFLILTAFHALRGLASVRDITRPAPWLHEQNACASPLPRTMNERAPIEPGIIPICPGQAATAPLRVTSTL